LRQLKNVAHPSQVGIWRIVDPLSDLHLFALNFVFGTQDGLRQLKNVAHPSWSDYGGLLIRAPVYRLA
jgi:hypothetical protein